MNYLNITKYIYLGVGVIMAYMAVSTWNDQTDKPWLYIMLAGLGFFTFFFRARFAKKFEDKNKTNSNK
jgi:hypothetical protein